MAKLVIGTNKQIVVPAVVADNTPSEKYPLYTRVKEDGGVEIGTVSGYFTDANQVKYAVVLLDAMFRNPYCTYFSVDDTIPALAGLSDQSMWVNKDTATSNCDKIVDYVRLGGGISGAVEHCRNVCFYIGNIAYYGQLPNFIEMVDVFKGREIINAMDPTLSEYSSLIVPSDKNCWTSSQAGGKNSWYFRSGGGIATTSKTKNYMALPVLEIPITE